MNSKIKQCYNLDDDSAALSCIKEEIKNNRDSCQPKIVLLVSDNCEVCAAEKSIHQRDIEAGLIRLVNIKTREGTEIALRNKIDIVPAILVLDCENSLIESD